MTCKNPHQNKGPHVFPQALTSLTPVTAAPTTARPRERMRCPPLSPTPSAHGTAPGRAGEATKVLKRWEVTLRPRPRPVQLWVGVEPLRSNKCSGNFLFRRSPSSASLMQTQDGSPVPHRSRLTCGGVHVLPGRCPTEHVVYLFQLRVLPICHLMEQRVLRLHTMEEGRPGPPNHSRPQGSPRPASFNRDWRDTKAVPRFSSQSAELSTGI